MELTTTLAQALTWTGSIVSGTSVDDFSRPTPCNEWDVHTLTNHLVGGAWMFAGALRGEPLPTGDPGDLVGIDPGTAYSAASAALLAAMGAEDVLERPTELPIGTVPGMVSLSLALTDTLTHGWDLAIATHQPTEIPSDLAAPALAFCESAIADNMRGPGAPFGAVVTAPDGATPGERLVAFLGRSPRPQLA
jgi:uncharacterized protein (TIGR03086 family)